MKKRLVRFDIRLSKDSYISSLWNSERRTEYLLRPDIAWPLSVDLMVWPSVFYSKAFQTPNEHTYGRIDVDPSIDDGNYWFDLEKMMDCYKQNTMPNFHDILIGIELFSEKSIEGHSLSYTIQGGIQCAMLLGSTSPQELPAESKFLGFDVADAGDISALSDCGYNLEERGDLSKEWSNRLNDFGLLQTYEDALKFKDVSENRIADHAPFWIYGISQLPVGYLG